MKLQNPFDRMKKKDFIPLSLFPADKMTRTSMQIGRAVPVYCMDMIKNNHIKIGANELTRFATMVGPVMSNFEVNLGYFFVPYVSLDGFFENSGVRNSLIMDNSLVRNKAVLKARKFFNASTDDSERVHPMQVSVSRISPDTNVNCSLFDHLGYLGNYTGINWADWKLYGCGSDSARPVRPTDWMNLKPYGFDSSSSDYSYTDFVFDCMGISDVPYIGYAWSPLFYSLRWWIDALPNGSMKTYAEKIVEKMSINYYPNDGLLDQLIDELGDYSSFKAWFMDGFKTIYESWIAGTYTGVAPGITVESFLRSYNNYILNRYFRSAFRLLTPNSTRYLAYMRIYADYFLDHHETPREDFLDLIGGSYLDMWDAIHRELSEDAFNFDTCFGHSNTGYHDSCEFFIEYLRKGDCLPVLWQKDSFTACRPDDVITSTPIGSTVEQNFYNRMYARFKDLIARLGTDYKTNSDSLYGGDVPDSTLMRSQVVGYNRFAVNVGDIAQTGGDTNSSNLGDFAGFALSRDSTPSVEWTAEENGMFMVIAWVRPTNVAYINHLDRDVLKSSYFDYLLPQFAGVGYQDKFLGEVYPAVSASESHIYDRFGVEERYAEYYSVNNECSGVMSTSHDFLHVDRDFSRGVPVLAPQHINAERYITPSDDINRIFKDKITDPVLMTIWFHGTVTRQAPATIQTDF